MKNIMFIFFVCLLLNVQNVFSQFKFGVEAGYVLNHFHLAHDAGDSRNGNGFKIGGIVSYEFNSPLFLETGFSFQQKKGSLTQLNLPNGVYAIESIRLDYYTLPVTVGAKWKIRDVDFRIKAGGFLACGGGSTGLLSGRDNYGQNYTRREVLFGNNNVTRPFNRFDSGVLCGGDIGYRQFQLRVAYEFGLMQVNSIIEDLSNRSFTVSLAYFL